MNALMRTDRMNALMRTDADCFLDGGCACSQDARPMPKRFGCTNFTPAEWDDSGCVYEILSLNDPLLSTLAAYVFLEEGISILQATGGLVILAGIYLAAKAEK